MSTLKVSKVKSCVQLFFLTSFECVLRHSQNFFLKYGIPDFVLLIMISRNAMVSMVMLSCCAFDVFTFL